MPPVDLHWYDGGLMPQFPEELDPDEKLGNWDGGILLIGDKGMISAGCYGLDPKLHFPNGNPNVEKPKPTLPRVEGGMGGQIKQWYTARIEGGEKSSRV